MFKYKKKVGQRKEQLLKESVVRKNEELLEQLISILGNYCGERGENEGAVDTLKRIIKERDLARNCLQCLWNNFDFLRKRQVG